MNQSQQALFDQEVETLFDMGKPKDSKGAWRYNIWPVIRAGRGDVEKAWKKLAKGKDEAQRTKLIEKIRCSLPEIARLRNGELQQKCMAQPVIMSRFLNDKRWLDWGGKEEKIKPTMKCTYTDCTLDVHGPRFDLCTNHLGRTYG